MPDLFALIDSYSDNDLKDNGIEIDREAIKSRADVLVESTSVLIGKVNGNVIGAIAGVVTPCGFSKEVYFNSCFFYIVPGMRKYTKDFLKEIELSLLPTDITQLVIGVPGFKSYFKLCRFMSLSGYKLLESHFYKKV